MAPNNLKCPTSLSSSAGSGKKLKPRFWMLTRALVDRIACKVKKQRKSNNGGSCQKGLVKKFVDEYNKDYIDHQNAG